MTPKAAAALERVEKFVEEHGRMRGLHPDIVYGLHTGCPNEAVLTIKDLRLVLKLARNCNLTITGPFNRST